MKRFYIIIFLLYSVTGFSQNQYRVTQYMLYQPIINPAAISTYQNLTVMGVARKQWAGISGAPSTYAIGVNSKISEKNIYLGGILLQDNIGDNSFSKVNLLFAYRAKLNKKVSLSFSLKGEANYFQSNFSNSYIYDSNDPEFANATLNGILPNFGFGTMLFSKKFYFGFSIPAFLKNTPSVISNNTFLNEIHTYITSGYSFKLNENFDLNSSVLFKLVRGNRLHFDINSQIMYNKLIGFGLNYRSSNDISAIFSWNISEKFSLSYAYDYTFSELRNFSFGSHEIMLIFNNSKPQLLNITSPRF